MGILYPRDTWRWYGTAGHLIVSRDCQFHLATLVGPWWVSTVGEWLPDSHVREVMAQSRGITLEGEGDAREASWMEQVGFEPIGLNRTYETMVFLTALDSFCTREDCACGAPEIADWLDLDSDGYNRRGDAQLGHEAMCAKWSEREPREKEET